MMKRCTLCITFRIYFASAALLEVLSRTVFRVFWCKTFSAIPRNTQFICKCLSCTKLIHRVEYITKIIAPIGAMNAAIAPSSDLIQQL